MLSCGKVVGRLSKITRHAHHNSINRTSKCTGINGIGQPRYSSDTKSKKRSKVAGATLKAEECTPAANPEIAKQATPSSPPPVTFPSGCPAASGGARPFNCEDICGPIPPKQPGDRGPGSLFRYWKQLLAALIIAGAGYYALNRSSKDKPMVFTKTQKKKEKTKKLEKMRAPATSSSIPSEVPYLLIGGGTAAFSAFRSIKSRDPKAKVLVVTKEFDLPYMRPPLSKELWYNRDRNSVSLLNFKQWNGTQRSLFYEPTEFYATIEQLADSDKGGVAIASGWKVKKIDAYKRIAILEDGYEIKYDKCLIATGATPKNIPIFQILDDEAKQKIMTFRTKEDFLQLEENINDPKIKNIVIVGGGFLGSELACSLARNLDKASKNIYQIYKETSIMSRVLPKYLSDWTTKRVTMEGVICTPDTEIDDFEMNNGQLRLLLKNGKTLMADQVIVAVGAQANTELAESSDLEVDPVTGGYLVNAELQARSNLWVAGDAASFYDLRLGRRRVEHHDHAVLSGRYAGENMTGGAKPYIHQPMFWSDLGPEVGYEAIGIIDSSLPTVSVFAKASNDAGPVTKFDENAREGNATASEKPVDKTKLSITSKVGETKEKISNGVKTQECQEAAPLSSEERNYGKGVVFYLKDDIVVGILLWNIFNRMSIARQVLARGMKYDDLNEVAKLFAIHEE